jgi:glycosyltransferase involved in cell wall biosynthesis
VTGQPLISLGLPVYNGEAYVREALDSLLAQTYPKIEIIVCDNASTDRTPEICAEYAARDPRVRHYRNATNIGARGPHGNIRRVFNLSSGDYFMLTGADDVRPPTVVADCVRAFQENPRAVMVHGPIQLRVRGADVLVEVANNMDLSHATPAERIRTYTRGLEHNAIAYAMVRRDILSRAKLRQNYGDDYLLCLKICLLGPVGYIRSPLIVYRQRHKPARTPMYPLAAPTLHDLVLYRGVRRNKCWIVLIVGCWYLLDDRLVPWRERVQGAMAHASAFVSRYRRELATELLFLLSMTVSWLAVPIASTAVRLRNSWRKRGIIGRVDAPFL